MTVEVNTAAAVRARQEHGAPSLDDTNRFLGAGHRGRQGPPSPDLVKYSIVLKIEEGFAKNYVGAGQVFFFFRMSTSRASDCPDHDFHMN